MDEEYLGFDKNRKRMGSSEELEELKKHSDPEFVKRAEEFRAEDERVKARRRKRMLEAQKAKEQMLAEAKEKEAAEAAAAEAAEEEQKGERQEHVAKEKETESNEDAKSGNGTSTDPPVPRHALVPHGGADVRSPGGSTEDGGDRRF